MKEKTIRTLGVILVTAALGAAVLSSLTIVAGPRFKKISITCGGAPLRVEIAANESQRGKGLMFRESVPEGTGMLFVYPDERRRSLWMKNTPVPLSAAFIGSDGKILELIDMRKTNTADIYTSGEKARYIIEAPLGWFAKRNIKKGDYCIIPDIPSR